MSFGWDPAKELEYKQLRETGCFACKYSKYGVNEAITLKTKRSYCELEAMIAVDYPNEDESTCKDFRRKNDS